MSKRGFKFGQASETTAKVSSEKLLENEASSTKAAEATIPQKNISSIKNKQLRSELFRQMKRDKRKEKVKEKKLKGKEAKANKEAGIEPAPKQVPRTIENTRERDVTMITGSDEELEAEAEEDELSSYFKRDSLPKVLITTSDRPRKKSYLFCKELSTIIPNSEYYYRRGLSLKRIIPQMRERGFTDLVVVNEDRGEPNGLVLCHLPDGPTATFKLSNVRLRNKLKKPGVMTQFNPELVCNNFGTVLGHRVCRLFQTLFPQDPQYRGRQAVTFHNQRDFIFFRHHRYMFRNEKRCGLQELGPRFTLKLRSLQKGTFDSKFGEYEWVHKRHEMDTSRRKFHL